MGNVHGHPENAQQARHCGVAHNGDVVFWHKDGIQAKKPRKGVSAATLHTKNSLEATKWSKETAMVDWQIMRKER